MEKKHHNKHIAIMVLIGFLLIVGGIVSYIIINYNDDQAEVKKRMTVVINTYENFKSDVESFNKIRDDIYNEVMGDMYYQTLKDNDTTYKELYKNYEKELEKIDKDYEKISDKCINVLHPDADANNKCEAMVEGYEEVVNTYISDINSYNSLIISYNKWLSDTNSSDSKLESIKVTREYLDINGDREYKGRKDIDTNITEEKDTGVEPDE